MAERSSRGSPEDIEFVPMEYHARKRPTFSLTKIDNTKFGLTRAGIEIFRLVVDDEQLNSSEIIRDQDNRWIGSVSEGSERDLLTSFSFADFKSHFKSLFLRYDKQLDNVVTFVSLTLNYDKGDHILSLNLAVNLEEWASLYTPAEYFRLFEVGLKEISAGAQFERRISLLMNGTFSFTLPISEMDVAIAEIVEAWFPKILGLSAWATAKAMESVRKDSVVTLFNFPKPVKTACEQYLVYFLQFLEDLGIRADSEIKEDAGRVLFSVTPKDGPSALGRIREALAAYLNLPNNPEFGTVAGQFPDMAVAQLKSNVLFLQSQLALAQAMLEIKNATIEALNFSVYQQRQLLTGSSADQAVRQSQKESDSEPIVGDTVHLTKYEGKFLKVDLPTILRRLKRSFGIAERKDNANG